MDLKILIRSALMDTSIDAILVLHVHDNNGERIAAKKISSMEDLSNMYKKNGYDALYMYDCRVNATEAGNILIINCKEKGIR